MRFSGWMRTSAFLVGGRGGGAHGHISTSRTAITLIFFEPCRYIQTHQGSSIIAFITPLIIPLISLATISDQPYRSVSRSGLITSKSYMGLSHTLNNTILKLLSPSPIPAFARSRSVWIRSGSSTDKQIVQDLGILFTICLQILNPTVEMNILT